MPFNNSFYGISDNKKQDASIKLTPSISSGIFNVFSDETISKIDIFDIKSDLILSMECNKNSTPINLSNELAGLYFVKIQTYKYEKVFKVLLIK